MYVVERWLARLSHSPYVQDFVLKGGMLLASFGNRRPTVDADALARNMPSDEKTVASRVAEIAARPSADDGVTFLTHTVTTRTMRDEALYSGVRVVMDARIATAQVQLRLDVNFGDPITPEPRYVEIPALRPDSDPVRLLGYPLETVLAEKLTTAINLGPANTRVRDYADIFALTSSHSVACSTIRSALRATAAFRGVPLRPLATIVGDLATARATTYAAHRRNLGESGNALPTSFKDVVDATIAFIDPVVGDAPGDARWEPSMRRWIL